MNEPVVAFQISINGKVYCESEDITALTMVAEKIQRRNAYRISLHLAAGEAPLQWLAADLKVGDEIGIRVVNVSELESSVPEGCSFCGREVHDVSTLVQNRAAAICDRCIEAFSAAVRNGTQLPLGASIRDEPDCVCAFCANVPGTTSGVVVRNGASVCPECLRACSDILASNSGEARLEAPGEDPG